MAELIVPAKVTELDRVIDFVNVRLERLNCNEFDRAAIDIAVEEIFVNIAHYAYEFDKEGEAVVRATVQKDPAKIVLQFIDSGTPYNPLEREDPDVELALDDRQIGGLGIFIVKESMDAVYYEYSEGKNILTIEKNF